VLEGVLGLAGADVVPGGTQRNHASVDPSTDWGVLELPEQLVLADAQTSGGLLIATPHPDALEEALAERDVPSARIGEVAQGAAGSIRLTGRLA
jgi:selenide,water dikinase